MNKRIQAIFKQALNEKLSYTWTTLTPAELEVFSQRFAELIVQKCTSQIALIGISNLESEEIIWTVETAIANIERHFGVKP